MRRSGPLVILVLLVSTAGVAWIVGGLAAPLRSESGGEPVSERPVPTSLAQPRDPFHRAFTDDGRPEPTPKPEATRRAESVGAIARGWEVFACPVVERAPRREDYDRVASGVGQPAVIEQSDNHVPSHLVVDWRDHARTSTAIGPGRVDLARVPRRHGATIWFVARHGVFPHDALLVDTIGRPYGTVGVDAVRLALPFRGFLLARGFAPVAVDVPEGARRVPIEWCRSGTVRGTLTGAFVAGESIQCRPGGGRGVGASAVVAEDGSFVLGPIAVGRAVLWYWGSRGELTHGIDVLEGLTDVGSVHVEPLGYLELRLIADRSSDDRIAGDLAFAALYFTRLGASSARAQRINVLAVEDEGRCRIPDVRGGEVAGFVWTPSGWFGEIPPTHRVEHGRRRSVDVAMRRPGTLSVDVHASFDVGGAWRVVAIDARHGFGARAFRARPDGGRTRLAVQQVGSQGHAEIDGLWPVEYDVSLVSPEGLVAASARATVWPGETTPVDLVIERDRATLVVRSDAAEPVRCMVLRDDDGSACCTVSIPAHGERAVRGLRPGRYGLLRLPARSSTPTRNRTLDVPRRHEVGLAPGESRVFTFDERGRERDPMESGR